MKMTVITVLGMDGESKTIEYIQKACDSVQASVTFIKYDELNTGDKFACDAFYNADVALIDLSVDTQRNSLFYHLGVRESFGQNKNIILLLAKSDKSITERFSSMKRHAKFPSTDYPILICDAEDDINSLKIKNLLLQAEIECKTNVQEKILGSIIRARENLSDQDSIQVLYETKDRLKDPDVFSEKIIHNLLLGFREIQDFNAIVDIVENCLSINEQPKISDDLFGIMYLYTFALIRCKGEGQRDKAIATILKTVENAKNGNCCNFFCQLGRIYKDMYIDSNQTDTSSLQEAIKWYRKAFEIEPNEYAGINLATLLTVSGEVFFKSEELVTVGMIINNLLGRKGCLSSIRDYWTLATFFEVNILTQNYSKAIEAAELMFKAKPLQWYIQSTMRNVQLIIDYRKRNAIEDVSTKGKIFNFWIEYFLSASQTKVEDACDVKIPVLLSESRLDYSPCYVIVDSQRKTVQISNNGLYNQDEPPKSITQQNWIFSKDRIKSLNLLQRDNRGVFLRLRKNSDDFHLFFPTATHRDLFHNTIHSNF